MITAGIATIRERESALKDTIASLLPQVDRINVYLNDYLHVPKFLDHPKIVPFPAYQYLGDLGDAGKFFRVPDAGIYLSCDDDIIYPHDYAEDMRYYLSGLHGKQFRKATAIGYHGARVKTPCKSYYKDREVFHFNEEWNGIQPVDVLGTGLLGFRCEDIQPKIHGFPQSHRNMADIHFAILADLQGVELFAIPSDPGTIKINTKVNPKRTIWATHHKKDQLQTDLWNGHFANMKGRESA